MLVAALVFACLFAWLGFRLSERARAATGRAPWGIPSPLWAVVCFAVGVIGLVLLLVARATTRGSPPPTAVGPGQWTASSPPPPSVAPAGWYADPGGAHQLRWYDGVGWTAHVSDQGARSDDPLPPRPPAP